jgi:hypothetical protein
MEAHVEGVDCCIVVGDSQESKSILESLLAKKNIPAIEMSET